MVSSVITLQTTRNVTIYTELSVQRVRKNALQLAHSLSAQPGARKPDLLTVELAALLHDVLDKKYVSADEAADPYGFFLPFFEAAGKKHGIDLIKDGRAQLIAKIVTNVSWSTEKKLRQAGLTEDWHRECVELHCVQDADRLDAIGAFGVYSDCVLHDLWLTLLNTLGILRCAAYSASVNRSVAF